MTWDMAVLCGFGVEINFQTFALNGGIRNMLFLIVPSQKQLEDTLSNLLHPASCSTRSGNTSPSMD